MAIKVNHSKKKRGNPFKRVAYGGTAGPGDFFYFDRGTVGGYMWPILPTDPKPANENKRIRIVPK